MKLEKEGDNVSGSVVVTVEQGKTGVGGTVGAVDLKTLEGATSIKLNGFVTKLEATLLSGELDFDVLDGVQLAFEAEAINTSVGADGVDVDLATVTVKLVGDVTHWIDAPPGVTLTIDGRFTLKLGGKLEEKLSAYIINQLDQKMLAKELDAVGSQLDAQQRAYRRARQQREFAAARGDAAEVRRLDGKVAEHKRVLRDGARRLDALRERLVDAAKRGRKLVETVRGKAAAAIARAMRARVVRFVALRLARIIPIVNFVATIIDIVEIVRALHALLTREYGGSGDSHDSGMPEASGEQTVDGPITSPRQVEYDVDGPITSPSGKAPSKGTVRGQQNAGVLRGPVTRPESDAVDLDDTRAIAERLPTEVVAQWVRMSGSKLVVTPAARAWRAKHRGRRIGNTALEDLVVRPYQSPDGTWGVTVEFMLQNGENGPLHGFEVHENRRRLSFKRYLLLRASQ